MYWLFFICNRKPTENQLLTLFYAYLCKKTAQKVQKCAILRKKTPFLTPKSHFFCQKWDSETSIAKGLRTSTTCNTLCTTASMQAPHVKKLLRPASNEATLKFFFIFIPATHIFFFYFLPPITSLVMCFRF